MRSSCAPGIRPADFARLCGTNKRTLLHYDEIGLFCPALRDDRGFRYYDESQCDVFMVIRSLRDLGMSLAEIKDYLDERTPDSLEALLRHQQQRVSQELARLERISSLCFSTWDNSCFKAEILVRIRRRSVSSFFSPGPLVPIPPPRRERDSLRPTRRADL